MSDTAHRHALVVAAALDEQPDQVDPEEAGAAGLTHLDVLLEDGSGTAETVELGLRLLAFATERLPEHPLTPTWLYRAGGAMSFLAEVLDSVPHLETAIAFHTAVARDSADPALSEQAAVDAAQLIRLRLTVAEDFTADDARRWTAEIGSLAPLVHSEDERLNFTREQALAHRWAYPHTLELHDLDHAIVAAETVLPHDQDNRAELLHALAILREERHRLIDDPTVLSAAIDAARELRALVGDDDRSVHAQLLLAGLLATGHWSDGVSIGIDEAVDAYAAVPDDVPVDTEHTVNHGVLLCARGEENEGVADLLAGTALLVEATDEPDGRVLPVLLVLAEAFLVLARLDGPRHLWQILDWTTAALTEAPEHDTATITRSWRLEAVEVAAKEFGIRAVMQEHDVRGFLADAERAVRDATTGADHQARALLVLRIMNVRTQWLMDVAQPGEQLEAALRNLQELLADAEPYLPPEAASALNGMVSTIEVTARFSQDGSLPSPSALEELMGELDGEGRSEADQVQLDLLRVVRSLVADPRQEVARAHVSRVTALAWRVDSLPESEHKHRLAEAVQLMSRAVGPTGSAHPDLLGGRAGTDRPDHVGVLLAQTHAWQTARAEGDVQQALRAYETLSRVETGTASDSELGLVARMVRGVYRAHLDADVPTDPGTVDSAIAELRTAFQQDPSPANALMLGSRLRLRDQPGDRADSRVAGLIAAKSDGDQVTAWCLNDGADDDLVRVLEVRRRVLLGQESRDGPTVTAIDDVIIYLVPGCADHEGFAATVHGAVVQTIPLPDLRIHALGAWREALEKARATPSWRGWTDALARVGAWAWTAAADAFTPWVGRRLILIPLGELGLVPWAAAWREVAGQRRYLVQENEITLLPTAGPMPSPATAGAALFVGNPGHTNGEAATIAESLRTAFHPGGRFLGGHGGPPRPWRESPQGRGTPDEVRAAARDGLALLHLGCRTTSDLVDPGHSSISLHGGDLPAAELFPAAIGLVTLTDHVTVAGGKAHDDALTLPARMVANGVRSVLSALWPEPSGSLIHLVHHHIGNGLRPSAALRAAQLQLLDPGRVLPPGLPPDLPLDPAEIEHWAVLAHHGR